MATVRAHAPRLLTAALLAFVLSAFGWASVASAQVCARVKIEIVQELTLERQAFDAKMKITNGLKNLSVEDIEINVLFEDAQGNEVEASSDPNNTTASFFITLDSLDGINAVDGTGVIAPETVGEIHWLIIPAPGAAGPSEDGTLYFVGAEVTYAIGGEARTVEVVPDSIYVKPMPMLYLDYFLPEQVHADNPYTLEEEPPTPFTLGVRVSNDGFGPANKLKIESSQPKIVENELGLLIAFEIIGSTVNGDQATPSLLVDFGDIAADTAAIARWLMTSTLQGKFIEFSATFSHADELGGQLTSLLEEVTTHTLVHDVLVDLDGRDAVRDFLADDNGTYRVYESDKVDTEVFDASSIGSLTDLTGGQWQLDLTGGFAGFGYVNLPDPLGGGQTLVSVQRADGRDISVPDNAWLSKVWDKDAQDHDHFINVFDHNNTGGLEYILTFGPPPQANAAPAFGATPDRKIRVGETLNYLVTATDPNGDAIVLQAAPLPSGALFGDNGNGTGVLTWTPDAGALGGTYPVDFSAWDGEIFGNAQADFIVVEDDATNSAPTSATATVVANKNELSAPSTPVVVDPDLDDDHFFEIVSNGAHGTASVVDNQLYFFPDLDYIGTDSFSFQAMDLFGETVVGTAQVLVVDDTNLVAATISAVGPSDAPTAYQVQVLNTGDNPTIVPVTVTLLAERCGDSIELGTQTGVLPAGTNDLVFSVDLSGAAWATDAGVVISALVDSDSELPEPNEFDNVVSQALFAGNAGEFDLRLGGVGSTHETYCAEQVLTLSGRSTYLTEGMAGDCLAPAAAGIRVDYALTDSGGTVVRSGTTFGDNNGTWHAEFGLPSAAATGYTLEMIIDDGVLTDVFRSQLDTVTCTPSIPPPMVPAPAFSGPDGDVPVLRINDDTVDLPWTVHPNMAIPTHGSDGSGTFGHTRASGNSTNIPPSSPALGSLGGPVDATTYDALVNAALFDAGSGPFTVGEVMNIKGAFDANGSYFGMPAEWTVLEPGAGAAMSIAPPTYYYVNEQLVVTVSFTPRVSGSHTLTLCAGSGYTDADDTNNCADFVFDVDPAVVPNLPVLVNVDPAVGAFGQTVAVTLTGDKFTSDATLDCGADIAISNLVVTLDDATFGTSATADFAVSGSATAGAVSCTLSTGFGDSTLNNAFTILESLCDIVTCDSPPSSCHVSPGTCDPGDGTCDYGFKAAGESCDDGITCTVGGTCDGSGLCGVADHLSCNDGIPCTNDVCDLTSGCLNVPADGSCDPTACIQGGDVNGSNTINVADPLCILLVSLWQLEGGTGDLPGCLAGPVELTDLNCSMSTTVSDVQVAISLILVLPFSPGIDRNANQCVDTCEVPDCGDSSCGVGEECLLCSDDCGGCAGDCCAAHGGPGCADATVQECVCDIDPECCSVEGGWDADCAAIAAGSCSAGCL